MIRGLNAKISLCEVFAKNCDITFNCKKTVYIKFGQKLIDSEHVYLNDKKIEWINQIKHHLENYIDRNLNDNIDCTHKKSIFIGQVNKLCANFGYLQMSALVHLLKLTVVHFMDLKCGKLIVNTLTVFVHLGIKVLDVF